MSQRLAHQERVLLSPDDVVLVGGTGNSLVGVASAGASRDTDAEQSTGGVPPVPVAVDRWVDVSQVRYRRALSW